MTSFFGVPCHWLLQVLQVLQLARSLSMTSFFWSILLLVAAGATGVTARKEFIYDVIFWSTLPLVATGATARKEFIYDVSFLEYFATGCYRCYGCNRLLCYQTLKVPCHCLLQVSIMLPK